MTQLLLMDRMCELNMEPSVVVFYFMHVPFTGSQNDSVPFTVNRTDNSHSYFLNHLYASCLLVNIFAACHMAVVWMLMRKCGINAAQVCTKSSHMPAGARPNNTQCNDIQRYPTTSNDTQRHPTTSNDIQQHPITPNDTQRHPTTLVKSRMPGDTQWLLAHMP